MVDPYRRPADVAPDPPTPPEPEVELKVPPELLPEGEEVPFLPAPLTKPPTTTDMSLGKQILWSVLVVLVLSLVGELAAIIIR